MPGIETPPKNRQLKAPEAIRYEQLAYDQIRESLQGSIQDQVRATTETLKHMDPKKAQRTIKKMERSLNLFVKYSLPKSAMGRLIG